MTASQKFITSLLVATGCALAVSACVPPAALTFPGGSETVDAASLAEAKGMYDARCASCHGAKGDSGTKLAGRATFDMLRTRGKAGGSMAPINDWSDAQVKAVAAYLKGL